MRPMVLVALTYIIVAKHMIVQMYMHKANYNPPLHVTRDLSHVGVGDNFLLNALVWPIHAHLYVCTYICICHKCSPPV